MSQYEYFIRASFSPEADIARGFSAVGCYVFGSTEAAARAEAEMMDLDPDDLAWHDELAGWVMPRAGLCAHDAFETLQEAMEAAQDPSFRWLADAGASDLASIYVFEGVRTFEQSMDDGMTFQASGKFWFARAPRG